MQIFVGRYGLSVFCNGCEFVFNSIEGEPWARVFKSFDLNDFHPIRIHVN